MATLTRPVCQICGDTIGVYEPILIVGETPAQPTSLAREPDLSSAECELIHLGCSGVSRAPSAQIG